MTRPEALRLAESAHLGYRVGWQRQAAAELRRLHAENERLRVDGIHSCHAECQRPVCRLTRERDALLPVALAVDAHYSGSLDYKPAYVALAREAIKAVKEWK